MCGACMYPPCRMDGPARTRQPRSYSIATHPSVECRRVELDFSRPGKPTDNAAVKSFNGRLRQECLNATWFLSLADAQSNMEAWRTSYKGTRPPLCARVGHTRRIRPPMLPAGSIGDSQGAGSSYF